MTQHTERSLTEVKARCMYILEDKEVIDLIEETSTPAAAFDVVFAVTKDLYKSKAARWLGIMRRDYPDTYQEIIQNINHP
ncbi:hypothetical protein ACFLZ0_00830 [Patescibacteria group bacterium]